MILENAFAHYKSNAKAAIAFALLLVFIPVFSMLENVFVSSGSMFLDYNRVELQQTLFFVPAFLLFLVFYSLLVTVIIFSVRKDQSKLKLHFYLHEMIQKFTFKIFIFFAAFSLLLYAIVFAMLWAGIAMPFIALLLLLISLLLLFVPQSIVVDEDDIIHAVLNNLEFISRNPKSFFQVLVVGSALLAVVTVIGELFDYFYLIGAYVSLLLTLIFVLPFVEVMKTYLYMLKFDLIKSPQLVSEKKSGPGAGLKAA